jgi:hypothetical protein
MKQQTDKKRRNCEFEVGDRVFLRLQPYRQSSVFRRAHQKLASPYFAPSNFEWIGAVAYKLALPNMAQI